MTHLKHTVLATTATSAQVMFGNLAVIAFAALVGVSIWDAIVFARGFGCCSVGYIEIETCIPQVPVLIDAALLALSAARRLTQALVKTPE
jgi:C4-dicarboxylate transporter DctQ subunit